MDTPRSGFRRAAVTSWALVGIGVAGVAGASTLAYTDTVKPPAPQVPLVAAVPATLPEEPAPVPTIEVAPAPEVVTTTNTPTTVMAPNHSPHVTVSRGS